MRSPFHGWSTAVLSAITMLLSLAFLSVATPAADATALPVPEGITLRQAVELAIRSNPAIVGRPFALAEAAARRDQADLRPPLVLGADLENIIGTGRAGVVDSLEATLRLSTVVELGAKRALRVGAAERSITAAAVRQDMHSLDVLADVTLRFIANLAAQEKVAIAKEHVERAREVVEAVRLRAQAGVGTPVEEGNALVHLRELEIALTAAESSLRRSWGALAATWAAPPDGAGRASGDLYVLTPLAPFAAFAAMIDKNPHVARLAAERAAAEARAQLARAGRTADITVSAGIRRLEALNDQALIFGLSVPLGAAGRNAPAEREAEAAASQAGYAATSARIEHLATLHGLYEQAVQSRSAFVSLREAIMPVAEQTLDRANAGFRAGRFSLFEVSAAQEQLHETEEAIVDAAETYHQAIAEIERLTDEPFEVQSSEGQGAKP